MKTLVPIICSSKEAITMNYLFSNRLEAIQLKAIVLSVVIFLLTILSILTFTNYSVTASRSGARTKRAVSIKIEAGDSLWSIAERYITPEYSDIKEFIKEIKQCNGINSDIIYENNYLIVPYYDGN